MAGTAAKKRKKGKGGDENYIVRGKGGKLFVASGKTGNVDAIKARHVDEIESLIKQRQELGLKLSQLLDEQGYGVAPTFPTIIIKIGPEGR
jgi:hypothetical protein